MVGDIEKEKLNLDTIESSTERENKEKVMKVKEKDGKAINVLVGQPITLSQSTIDYNLRPNGSSSMRNKKKATRASLNSRPTRI